MKDICKTILSTLFLLNACITTTLGQTEVTRYTPNGSPVRAYNEITEMSSEDKEDWSDYVTTNYPQATELNTHSATRSYNCHAYAWHISEGGDNVWIGYYSWQTADEDVDWTDGSYLNQSAETGAEKISYYNGNHSAIQTSTVGIYKSKWGEGPLMQHARNYGPSIYNMSQRKYYVRPYISGSSTVCTSNSTFTLHNRPPNSSVSWTHSSNLTPVGCDTCTTYTVRAKNSYVSGSGWVKANVNGAVFRKNFWVGKPVFDLNGPTTIETRMQGIADLNYQGNASVTNVNWSCSGAIASVTGSYVVGRFRAGSRAGMGSVYATATNICGSKQKSLLVEVTGGWRMSISPNPATSVATITINIQGKQERKAFYEDEQWDIEIYNPNYVLQERLSKLKGNTFEINTSSWKEGIYYIKAKYKDKVVTGKMIIKK